MSHELILILGIFLIGLIFSRRREKKIVPKNIKASVFYIIFVLLVAGSPLIGAVVAISLCVPLSFKSSIAFMWIGVGLSLPVSLALARLSGQNKDYWHYLEALSNKRRKTVTAIWGGATMLFLIVSAVIFLGL